MKVQLFVHLQLSLEIKKIESMNFEMTGTLYQILPPVQRTSTFKIREFVIENVKEISGKSIVNYIKFQTTQDRTGILDQFKAGDQVRVHFNIRGSKKERDGTVTYFNNLEVWRIEHALKVSDDQPDRSQSFSAPGNEEQRDENDKLPF